MTSFPQGQWPGFELPPAGEGEGLCCVICGRPLRPGEDLGPWRLRVIRPSPLWYFKFLLICPTHYEDGAHPLAPATWGRGRGYGSASSG